MQKFYCGHRNVDSLRGWLNGEISAGRLTYLKEEYNLNKKGSYFK